VILCSLERNLRGGIGLFGWHQSRFSKAIMGDERIRRPGDAWQRAIGNVIVALVFPFSLYWSSY
jgi:hypothetical protein